mmetsp:Transcript_23754/g.60027  ORF Transcript_23754/g.60027 Transcript_23754/m.60027 type:complete len:237 (-) Transcript_23754:354-1064(-)
MMLMVHMWMGPQLLMLLCSPNVSTPMMVITITASMMLGEMMIAITSSYARNLVVVCRSCRCRVVTCRMMIGGLRGKMVCVVSGMLVVPARCGRWRGAVVRWMRSTITTAVTACCPQRWTPSSRVGPTSHRHALTRAAGCCSGFAARGCCSGGHLQVLFAGGPARRPVLPARRPVLPSDDRLRVMRVMHGCRSSRRRGSETSARRKLMCLGVIALRQTRCPPQVQLRSSVGSPRGPS